MRIRIGASSLWTKVLAVLLVSLVSACGKPSVAPAASPAESKPAASASAPAASAAAPAPAVAANTPPAVFDENFLKNEPKHYSQFREEVVIRYYFKDKRNGFFLDVGCAEWQLESSTYYLESVLGWKGIGIDARKELAKDYAEHRPGTRFFNFLVTDHSGTEDPFYLTGRLSSGNKDHLEQFGVKDAKPEEVEVPSITLNDLLAHEKVPHIDFINMDIEGFEPAALAGFDIDRYQPTLVDIEAAPKTRDAIMKYFTDHGYRRMDEFDKVDNVNWYFEKKKP